MPSVNGQSAPSAVEVNKLLQKRVLFLIPGLSGILTANYLYPLLDNNLLLVICLIIFATPVLLHILAGIGHRLPSAYRLLRRAYSSAAVFAALFAAILVFNGALDKSAAAQIRSVVLRRDVSRGRTGTVCSLFVSSWRPGRMEERLEVSKRVFDTFDTGDPILIDIHPGSFGLAWSSGVHPVRAAH